MKKVLSADVLSPILAYMRLNAPHKMILESIPREKENARFSIVAYRPVSEVKFEHGILYYNDQIVEEDPLGSHKTTSRGGARASTREL